jgi:Recombination endonuclease VII
MELAGRYEVNGIMTSLMQQEFEIMSSMLKEMACARPTPKHPEGRTGTTAGYMAHRSAHDVPCSACNEAWVQDQIFRRSPDYRQAQRDKAEPAREPGDACKRNPDRKYAGVLIGIRTGTAAGYLAHYKAREEACAPCKEAQAARTAIRRGADPDAYGAYQQALREYEQRVHSGEPVPLCAKPTTQHPEGRTGTADGWHAHYHAGEPACEPCIKGNAADQAQRRIDEPDLTLRGNLYGKYRLSLERYLEILAEQGGKCAICGVDAPTDIRTSRFHVDHDHGCCPGKESCGKCVRGLLCHFCNTALGNFRDDPDILLAALSYLLSHGKEASR